MKKIKKLASVVLALIMVLAMALPVGATGTGTETPNGSITIEKAKAGYTYTIYEILKLESYNQESKAYSYKATSDWNGFINSEKIKDIYVTVDSQGYVTWKDGASVADFAKLAQKHAADNGIGNQGSKKAEGAIVEFTGLELGYYLLDSDMGTLCSLDTTQPNATIKEKNDEPTLEKEVKEGNSWGNVADAERGKEVEFRVTITAKDGAQKYVMHDKMDAGLSFIKTSVEVTLEKASNPGNPETVTGEENYTVTEGVAGCTFHVEFTEDFCDKLAKEDKIVVSYRAMVNKEAFLSDHGVNEAWLKYGEDSSFNTEHKTVKVNTWQVPFFKYYVKSENGETKEVGLSGAKFKLYRDEEATDEVIFDTRATAEQEGIAGVPLYRVNPEGTVKEITTENNGRFVLRGLDSGTYYLKETEAPTGYNKLSGIVKIVISADGTVEYTYGGTTSTADGTIGVKIENKTGSLLPETGGIGTTIFYVVGGILVVGAAVLLVTRKRMSAER